MPGLGAWVTVRLHDLYRYLAPPIDAATAARLLDTLLVLEHSDDVVGDFIVPLTST